MADPLPFKPKHSYPVIKKEVNGETIEVVCIDELTEEQFKQYCRDTGTEYFRRFGLNVNLDKS